MGKGEKSLAVADEEEEVVPWSFMDSLLFAFTIITTIGESVFFFPSTREISGYGNVAPKTTMGRAFVILYGLVGIPFTLLAIADLGKFLSEIMFGWGKSFKALRRSAVFFRLLLNGST